MLTGNNGRAQQPAQGEYVQETARIVQSLLVHPAFSVEQQAANEAMLTVMLSHTNQSDMLVWRNELVDFTARWEEMQLAGEAVAWPPLALIHEAF
jgi:hypothetical protein